MSPEKTHSPLHLPSLSIKGFRGIKDLSISRLGRVTLLAGKNSVGKTTVLDAVRVYAARGRRAALSEVLERHGEIAELTDSQGKKTVGPHMEAIFHGRDASQKASFSIGSNGDSDQLACEAIPPENNTAEPYGSYPPNFFDAPVRMLRLALQNKKYAIPWYFSPLALSFKIARNRRIYQYVYGASMEHEMPSQILCESVGPERLEKDRIAALWDAIALTDVENKVLDAIQPLVNKEIERIAIIGNSDRERQVWVKIRGQAFPVPLASFGDGALRFFSIALLLFNSSDGFLLIDEAESGIHHSVQRHLWRTILNTATEKNVQVLATTHSFDCIRGFAQTMAEREDADGALVRIERKDDEIWAVEYPKGDLNVAAEQDIEVR